MFGSCGKGCRLLWSDPNKQSDGYGTVDKSDLAVDSDDSFEDDAFNPDIVFSQPSYPKTIWTEQMAMSSPIVRNNPLSNLQVNGGALSHPVSRENNTPIVKKSIPVVKDVSPTISDSKNTTSTHKQTPSVQNSFERPSPHVGVHASSYTPTSPKSPKKDTPSEHASDDAIQMVSVV